MSVSSIFSFKDIIHVNQGNKMQMRRLLLYHTSNAISQHSRFERPLSGFRPSTPTIKCSYFIVQDGFSDRIQAPGRRRL